MADQPSSPPPPKPKPGSLRDRIAAFEKPAASSPPPPPLHRPKPGGVSWKPKPPSPPSSPPGSAPDAPEPSRRASGGMSATDAKESIGRGGTLRERMAALQGRGGFGAPPPPSAPKPSLEKPKWKPPPVVHHAPPIHSDQDPQEGEDEGAEKGKEPLVIKPTPSVDDHEKKHEEEGEAAAAPSDSHPTEGDEATEDAAEPDPEEEERQRRAAIAARMARLGGARVGMAPPPFGIRPTPPPKKIERKEEAPHPPPEPAAKEEGKPKEERVDAPTPVSTEDAVEPTANEAETPPKPVESPAPRPSPPSRQPSTAEHPTEQELAAPRGQTSMPVPVMPKRAAPPRRKPARSVPAPPPEDSPPPALDEPEASPPHPVEPEKDETKATESPPEVVAEEVESAKEQEPTHPVHELASEPHGDEHQVEAEEAVHSPEVEAKAHIEPRPDSPEAVEEPPASSAASTPEDLPAEEPAEHDEPAHEAEVEEEEDEEARRKRIAEKLAKMGGINPFAPPPVLSRRTSSTDDVPKSHPAPARKASTDSTLLKQSSLHIPEEVAEPHVEEDEESPKEPAPKPVDDDDDDVPVAGRGVSEEEEKAKESQDESQYEHSSTHTPASLHEDDQEPRHPDEHEAPSESLSAHISEDQEAPESIIAEHQLPEDSREDTPSHLPEKPRSPPPLPVSARPRLFPAPPTPGGSAVSSPIGISRPIPPEPPRLSSPPLPPARTVPLLPPPPLSPPPLEGRESDYEDASDRESETVPVPPPRPISTHIGTRRHGSDDDGSPPLRIPPPGRSRAPVESDSEDAPLPVPHRRSMEETARERQAQDEEAQLRSPPPPIPSHSSRPMRAVPPPPPPPAPEEPEEEQSQDFGNESEEVSEYDETLPTLPERRTELPYILPPRAEDEVPHEVEDPNNGQDLKSPISPGESSLLTPTLSVSDQEVLDEEEGDPIDPTFHSPSRRASALIQEPVVLPTEDSLRSPTSPHPPPPVAPITSASPPSVTPRHDRESSNEDTAAASRKSIADRMARLGGIKFGAAPIPPPLRPPPRRDTGGTPEEEEEEPQKELGHTPEPSEEARDETEEDERARRERIAAKLAGMGGMRIGMMPTFGKVPKQSHILRDEPSAPPPVPTAHPRAVPPARPPLPPQPQYEPDSEHDSHASDDGVRVEAEESEIEEVSHAEAREELEEEAEEIPPPVPARTGSYTKPSIPYARPPVPASFAARRASGSTVTSVRKSSAGSELGQSRVPPPPPGQSDYVLVEEPQQSTEEAAPPPPPRPSHRPPPPRSVPPPPPPPGPETPSEDLSGSISSQWELPSIPTGTLEFGASPDLSLSWSEDSTSDLAEIAPPPPIASQSPISAAIAAQTLTLIAPPQVVTVPPVMSPTGSLPRTPTSAGRQPPPKPLSPEDLHLSSDDLMSVWGRVGVQVCEVATSFYERSASSKKSSAGTGGHVFGDGTYQGFVDAVLRDVPNAATHWTPPSSYGYLIYQQTANSVQKRVTEIMPGDVVELVDARLKGHKGITAYNQVVEELVGIVSEFEPKKSKIRVFQANLHPGQQSVESISYRLDDLKSGTIRVYRVLEAV